MSKYRSIVVLANRFDIGFLDVIAKAQKIDIYK